MKTNDYFNAGNLLALAILFPYLLLIAKMQVYQEGFDINIMSFLSIIVFGREYSYILSRQVFDEININLYYQTILEKYYIYLKIIKIFLFVSIQSVFFFTNNLSTLMYLLIFMLCYFLISLFEGNSIKIADNTLLVGRFIINLKDIKNIIIKKNRIEIIYNNKKIKIRSYFLLNKENVFRRIKELKIKIESENII